jgi:acyl carrier protein
MEKVLFLIEFSKLIETEQDLDFDTNLKDLSDYDSLTLMGIAAWISDVFSLNCNVYDIENFRTIHDFYKYTHK